MWSRNSWLPPIFAISSMLISLLCVLSVQYVHFPSIPGPERSNSAVNSSSRQCSGSQTAARESYLQPNATASSVGFPQLQDVIVGVFSDWPVAAFSESTCAWVFVKGWRRLTKPTIENAIKMKSFRVESEGLKHFRDCMWWYFESSAEETEQFLRHETVLHGFC